MTEPIIDIIDAEVGFGGPPVLRDFNLKIDKAETVIVLGASGSGKSTMLSLILGLIHPLKGQVFVGGDRVDGQREADLYPIRQKIGMVFQHGALFDSETVATNVGFRILRTPFHEPEYFASEVSEKLAFVGLSEYGERLPGELSGGQRKRVAIARAMVGNPEIMLYDEPTTGLDPITARKVLSVLTRVKEELGTTSIVVTHELHYAWHVGDRVVLIRDGTVAFDGTPDQFRDSTDPYIVEFRSMEAN